MPKPAQIVIAVAVLALLGVGVWWGVKGKNNNANNAANTNTSQNNTSNVNSIVNFNGSISTYSPELQEYTNDELGISFRFPTDYSITENIGRPNETRRPAFGIYVDKSTDSTVGNELVISNRAVGFEEETILKSGSTTIDGKPVRWEVTSEEISKVTHYTKRYLFSPLNLGSQYSEYWIAFPVDSDGENDVYEQIVQSIKLLK